MYLAEIYKITRSQKCSVAVVVFKRTLCNKIHYYNIKFIIFQAGIKQCDIFDPSTGDWSSIEPLKIGRYQAGVCAYDNKVYAVGGCDSWNCLNSAEIYDPTTNSWSMGPPLITARRGCGLAVFHGRLYAVGGSTGTHSLTSTEVYDPSEQVWVPGPSMCTPRANVAVAVVGDRLVFFFSLLNKF